LQFGPVITGLLEIKAVTQKNSDVTADSVQNCFITCIYGAVVFLTNDNNDL